MSDLDARFEAAAAAVLGLAKEPGDDVKLTLYALYKQATVGDADGKRPGFTNLVGRVKHDAWAAHSGTSQEDAKTAYIALAEDLTKHSSW